MMLHTKSVLLERLPLNLLEQELMKFALCLAKVMSGRTSVRSVVSSVPLKVFLDSSIPILGTLKGNASAPFINLAYEPISMPMTLKELEATGAYSSPSEFCQYIPLAVGEARRFEEAVMLNYDNLSGLYHIRVWVDSSHGSVLATDVAILVSDP